MKYTRIAGTGGYLPTQVVSNVDLANRLSTTAAWILKRTGIQQRHIAVAKESASFMATEAAKKALAAANATTVDMVIVATTTPDAFFPSTACLLQAALGLDTCPAFDIAAACTGFNYALTIADQFIRTGQCQRVLVVGTEVTSQLVDWLDRSTCILFGDGAGAAVLSVSDTPGIIHSILHADGKHEDLLYANNLRAPDARIIKMQGPALFRQAVAKMGETILNLLAEQQMTINDLDWFIPHQANLKIIQSLAKRLKFPLERVVITIASHANTSSASIPLALDYAIRKKHIRKGERLLLGSFGGGITWGATLIQY